MIGRMTLAVSAFAMLAATPALAQDAIDVTIGVLNDRSGLYADLGGEGSVIATQMAIEDFGAEEKGLNVEVLSADHDTSGPERSGGRGAPGVMATVSPETTLASLGLEATGVSRCGIAS